MKIIFFGSDDFAATSLTLLLNSSHRVVAVVTKPDAPKGRGMKLSLSPVKVLAAEHDIPYFQPTSLKDELVAEQLKEFQADLFVVVAYGLLLTQDILNIPKMFCVNVHGSLLPKYRGAAPINWAILNGDKQTGVTIQKMVLGLDAGDIIAQAPIPIDADTNAADLRLKMAAVGASLLVNALNDIASGTFTLIPQDEREVSYAPRLNKEMARIDWALPAEFIYNQVRGLKPWPGTLTTHQGKVLKVLRVSVVPQDHGQAPGYVLASDKSGITIACGLDAIRIEELQPESGKPMSAASYTAGHPITSGQYLH